MVQAGVGRSAPATIGLGIDRACPCAWRRRDGDGLARGSGDPSADRQRYAAAEDRRRGARGGVPGRWTTDGARSAALRVGAGCGPVERHDHGPVEIRPEHLGLPLPESVDRRRSRMTVRVAGTYRDRRDPWSHDIEERARRRRPTAVVGDLEEVDAGQAAGQERRVDTLLDVAGEHESLASECPEEHDRHVVDPGPGVARLGRYRTAVRPQDVEPHVVKGERVAGREAAGGPALGRELGSPGAVAGAGSAHARFDDT
jgi:hypothetical protein